MMKLNKFRTLLWTQILLPLAANAQSYPWPLTPLNQSHEISGTFCEYRDTGSSDHFHNGVDIPKVDGSPVYAVSDAVVTGLERNSANAYLRAGLYAYVHIKPASSLSVGDSVFTGKTIVGTILSGAGHVHLNDGYYGSEINALRQGGGLTPFDDPWPPIISDIRFFLHDSQTRLLASKLSGKVRITFRVQEQNGPPGASAARRNNGAYWVGYKILDSNRSTIVFAPANDGIQFKFDSKPDNGYVHNVFDKNQATLSNHVYNITNRLRRKDYWDTEAFSEGDYTVMLFAGDTRGNADTAYVNVTTTRLDLIAPAQPVLQTIVQQHDSLHLSWTGVADVDLAGYRLYTSPNNRTWALHSSENELVSGMTSTVFQPPDSLVSYYYLTAVDTAAPGNESEASDTYAVALDRAAGKILIVDSFDRIQNSGSYHEVRHPFATTHARALAANGFGFSTCANEAIVSGKVKLTDYDAVFWLLGDESTTDETFSAREQGFVRKFLEDGGFLFVSGSEIAWDLGAKGSFSDQQFMQNYLKIDYESDDAKSYTVRGVSGTVFAGIHLSYGISTSPYPEDYPDTYKTFGGSTPVLRYGNNKIAAVQYEGTFGEGHATGKLIVMGFPFETITTPSGQNIFFRSVLEFLFPQATAVSRNQNSMRPGFYLSQNFPNPLRIKQKTGASQFTQVEYSITSRARLSFRIIDILGRTVKTWPEFEQDPGFYRLIWDGRNGRGEIIAAGVYFWQMQAQLKDNVKNSFHRKHIKILVQ